MNRLVRNHPLPVALAAGSALILTVGVGGLGALAGLFHAAMMAAMAWMMVAMVVGHGQGNTDGSHDQ